VRGFIWCRFRARNTTCFRGSRNFFHCQRWAQQHRPDRVHLVMRIETVVIGHGVGEKVMHQSATDRVRDQDEETRTELGSYFKQRRSFVTGQLIDQLFKLVL
jgi:hypothetical protein